MATALEWLRNSASAHAQGPAQFGDNSVDAHEDGGASSIHISVKTTAKYHNNRLVVMMLTWMRTVPDPAQVSHRYRYVIILKYSTFTPLVMLTTGRMGHYRCNDQGYYWI